MEDIKIDLEIDKEPYIKKLTDDKVINLTGSSGSGKSYYCQKYKNDENYILIDTDVLINNHEPENQMQLDLKNHFLQKFGEDYKDNFFEELDFYYTEIINYFKDSGKTLVIDTAILGNIGSISTLKGTVIVLRTCVNTCYKRCVERYNKNHPNATEEEKKIYAERKKKIYNWYHILNNFLEKLENYEA